MMATPRFPTISPDVRKQRLAPPIGRRRVVIDTDTANEIDDQFALAWALQSPDVLDVEAVLVEPYSFAHLREQLLEADAALDLPEPGEAQSGLVDSFSGWAARLRAVGTDVRNIPFPGPAEGVEEGYHEAVRVYEKVGLPADGKVFVGSPRYLPSVDEPVDSPAADRLIELAMAPADDPLYVVAIGCVTNVAAAILKQPEIINRIVVLWTAGYPSWSPRSNLGSLNLDQDVAAAHVLFDSGVPLMYFPGFYIGAQLRLSLPEMESWVRGKGAIGDYLYHLYTNNPLHAQRGIPDHFGRTWVIWDMITIAWLIEPGWVPTELVATPTLDEDLYWVPAPGPERLMREAHGIDRDAIFRDFFSKLEDSQS
jgi:inosine-uridine nucleoside N-ribohydrolase